ncbi:hypothetical protein NEMBOFW57_000912 [Staphylotrichum longicolle]|uniref:PUM-HD domain-containing protein n=1 Tax=Staphylotrichum longicolle TaxID=669026 RepID=A0AAD4F0J6_9PEZI|nr:hypothetical protein NEMBOFW57_000912 [Staphylotrichum longicolle]
MSNGNGNGSASGNDNGLPRFGNGIFSSSSSLQSGGPWNNNATGSFARSRDQVTPRGESAREVQIRAQGPGLTGYTDATNPGGAFRSTSNADAWLSWYASADPSQARTVSGNTSPRTRSDASTHDMNGLPKYLSTAASMAPGASIAPQPATTAGIEPSSSAFKYPSSFADYTDEAAGDRLLTHDIDRRFSSLSVAAQRQAQEASFSAVGSGPSRNAAPSRPEPDHHSQISTFRDFSYGVPTASAMHSQRPSLAGSSFPTHSGMGAEQGVSSQQQSQEQMVEAMAMLSMDSAPSGAMNGALSGPSYGNGSQSFQFNPVSQPWENAQGYGNGFAKDAYVNGMSLEKRGSIVDRNSPAGSTYHGTGGLNSPRSFTNTPQQTADAWSRPVSRNPRMGSDLDRRSMGGQYYLQQQQQQAAHFPTNSFYTQNYPQFANPYGAYSEMRHPQNLPAYGMPFSPYGHGLGSNAIPTRPARDQDPGKGFRSALLDEFINQKSTKGWELKDIWNHVVEFSGDQKGSRFIQQKLETANSDEKDQIFGELESNAIQLMKDLFGNYVMQKLFEYGNQIQKKVLAGAMKGKVVDLSMQAYACRVVQKALEHVLVEQQAELAKELEPDLLKVAKDQHGNHVVQQAIALVPRQHIDFIIDGFKNHVCELASHQYGCRVVQRILEHGTEADKAMIMQELHNSAQLLVTDQYGNYVIQHVLEKGSLEDRSRMIAMVTPQLLTLSRHKNASNVVEKCILFGTHQEQRAIRDQLVIGGDDTNSPLFQLMRDQFGNYVIQKLVKALQDNQDQGVLVDKLASHLQSLKRSGATSKQIEAMERLVRESQIPTSPPSSKMHTPASTAPTSPGLRVDINSAAPTPSLTMGPNSPLSTPSSNPPYLNGDAVEVVNSKETALPPSKP